MQNPLPLRGITPVVREPLQLDTRPLAGGISGNDGARAFVQYMFSLRYWRTSEPTGRQWTVPQADNVLSWVVPQSLDAGNEPRQHIIKLPGMARVRQWVQCRERVWQVDGTLTKGNKKK